MWDVFLFDMRRTLRSRSFWYFLFGWSLTSLLITSIAYATILFSNETNSLLEERMENVFHALVIGQGILVLLLLPGIAEGNLAPEFTRKTQENLFLTALPARTILIGKWLMVGALAGLTLLTSLPAGLFACRISGLPISFYFISMFLLLSGALLACSFTFHRLATEHFLPESIPKNELPSVKKQSSSGSWDASLFFLAGIGFFVWFIFLSRRSEIVLPIYAFAPPLASLMASKTLQLGSLGLPFWTAGGTMVLTMAFFMVLAGAQWLGDWNGRIYRLLRNGGMLWFLLLILLHAYLAGSVLVHSALEAAQYGRNLLYASLVFYCYFCHHQICSFGLPRGAEEKWAHGRLHFLKQQPLSGSLQELFTFAMMAVLIPVGIYLGSGWLPGTEVLIGWLLYFTGLGFLLTAWASRLAWGRTGFPLLGRPQFSSLFLWVRLNVKTAISVVLQTFLSFIFVGFILRLLTGAHPVIAAIANLLYHLIPLYPLMAQADAFYYQVYGVILFLLGGWIMLRIQVHYRRLLSR